MNYYNIIMTLKDKFFIVIYLRINIQIYEYFQKNSKPYSFQKANKEGIKMMKLPLSETLEWGTGSSKNLPINQVLSVMLELKRTKDWNTALNVIPKRKLKQNRDEEQRKRETMLLNYTQKFQNLA